MLVCHKKSGLKILAFSQGLTSPVYPFPPWLFSKLFFCLGAAEPLLVGCKATGFNGRGGGGVSTASWEAGIWVKASKRRLQGASAPLVLRPRGLFASCLCF